MLSCFFGSPVTGVIVKFIKTHSHSSPAQRLRAKLEETSVVNNMVASCSTQNLKPAKVLSKVIFLL